MTGFRRTQGIAGVLIALSLAWAIGGFPAGASAQETGGVVVFSKLIKGDIPAEDPTAAVWDTVPAVEFPMSAQVHWEPRIFSVTVHAIQVKSVHNDRQMAILLIYKDPTNDPGDGAALEFMVGDKKAHFAHGQPMAQVEGGPVNIWFWKNADQTVKDMSAKGFGTLAVQPQQDVKGKGAYKNGEYRVVFSRSLIDNDPEDAQFPLGKFQNIAFAVWDGSNNEKGAQKAVTSWWYFRPEPPPDPTVYVYTGAVVLLVGAVEWVIVRRLRRKDRTA
ncbi:MAG TPA: ethylbenzene dehydrogenase-related protein [Nitrospiria bacterium]|nr:ethylbenzene dehydrogenase-related protein [Nitrospiria bacterium]